MNTYTRTYNAIEIEYTSTTPCIGTLVPNKFTDDDSCLDIDIVATQQNTAVSPEKRLWLAVLCRAIRDVRALLRKAKREPENICDPEFQLELKDITDYFAEASMELGGFGFICEMFDLDQRVLRNCVNGYLNQINGLK